MALEDVTSISPDASSVVLLLTANAANGIPTGTAGIAINALKLFGQVPSRVRVAVISTAGSGTMTATMRVWGRMGATIGWVVAKALNAADTDPFTARAIAETGADTIAYSEIVELISAYDRLYFEIVAIAGTSTSVKGEVVVTRATAIE